jgi:hypothetical protein
VVRAAKAYTSSPLTDPSTTVLQRPLILVQARASPTTPAVAARDYQDGISKGWVSLIILPESSPMVTSMP